MASLTDNRKLFTKILYYGMGNSGKTTIVDTLYQLTKESKLDFTPTGNLTKISLASGATLYFDRGTFQSTSPNGSKNIFFHVYTVAGQKRFAPLRKKIFTGTDAVIFVVDSQTRLFEDNVESLKELKNVAQGRLIKEIPLVIMLNKQDLREVIGEDDFKQVLKDEKLWFEPDHELFIRNPIIYKTCALYDKKQNDYRSFVECARQAQQYSKF